MIENKRNTQFPCNTREKREALFNCKIWVKYGDWEKGWEELWER